MAEVFAAALVVVHLGLLGTWLGSMLYSLLVVQPRAARFFGTDDDAREAFLLTLGAGNRRPVLAIIAAAVTAGVLIPVLRQDGVPAYGASSIVVAGAAAVFIHVSWRLWPRRVFALPEERAAHRAALHRAALALVGLVGTAFVLAVVAAMVSGPG